MSGRAATDAKLRDRSWTGPELEARAASNLTAVERLSFPRLGVFCNYLASSRPGTELSFVRVLDGSRCVAVAPVVRLRSLRFTDLLAPPALRFLGRLGGPLARRTVLLLDTGLRAYDYVPPVICAAGVDPATARDVVFAFLREQEEVDAVWVAEPAGGATGQGDAPCARFPILPMVHVPVQGCRTMDDHLRTLSRKRRRNHRQERRAFERAGAAITEYEAPLEPDLLRAVLACLEASARRSSVHVPYAPVLNDADALARQPQTFLVGRIAGEVIGFFSLVQQGSTLLQTHGGLDYARSLEARAYHNLTYAAIELAIRRGCERLSLGPLNNETKRRCGTQEMPMQATLWCRGRLDRFLMRRFLIRRLQVYAGPRESAGASPP